MTNEETSLRSKGVREEGALQSSGRREVTRLRESAQMRIALTIVGGGFVVQAAVILSVVATMLIDGTIEAPMLTLLITVLGTLSSTQSLIIGFYFRVLARGSEAK